MSWGGSAAAMNASIRDNRALLLSNRDRHRRIKDAYLNAYAKRDIHYLKSHEIPKEELLKIRAEIRKTLAKERRIAIIKTLLFTIVIFSALVFVIIKFLIPFIPVIFSAPY